MKNFNQNLIYKRCMIISCPSCKKKFEIDVNLIPKEGRNLQCGSCNHVWFYKFEKNISDLEIKDNTTDLKKKMMKLLLKKI